MTRRKRILFVAEAVTLAHVGRPAALMQSLDASRFEAFFAGDPRCHRFVTCAPDRRLPLASIDSHRFADRLRVGRPVYEAAELSDYVRADLALIERVAPDLIVGDFRLSLSVSARLARVPYAGIANAYWSPYALDRSLPLPVLPWTRWAPLALVQPGFDAAQGLVLAGHCRALNEVRTAHGLSPLPPDLRTIYTDADQVLYADSPALFPLPDAPAQHRHLGPVLWSPPVPEPPWLGELPTDRPLAYVTMGSSGRAGLLEVVLDSLAGLGIAAIVSTAGAEPPRRSWPHVWLADYLPGQAAAARSALVICNGGSPTAQQALAAGVRPVGICGNMDQMLNMRGLVGAGLGISLRADRLTPARIRAAVAATLSARGQAVPTAASAPDFVSRFAEFLEEWPAR